MVSSSSFAQAAAASLAFAATAAGAAITTSSCSTGVKMIVARGSKEPAGFGDIQSVVDAVKAQIPNSSADPVDYPALLDTQEIYAASVIQGTSTMRQMVQNYAAKCPKSKIALIGYSQGAQVVGDVLCGLSSAGFPTSADLGDQYANNVIASVMFGDPTRAANQAWNAGNITTRDGLFPRVDNAGCAPYGAGMKSWCDADDRYCDRGSNQATHHVYFEKYTADAAAWVVSRFQATA
ncbi:hypothetical protein RB596_006080 [Gaeumannomyces avenae]